MRNSSLNLIITANATCKDLLSCLYDLSSSDMALLALLLRRAKPQTLDDLADYMGRDRGTVFRSLQKLVSLGFCTKQTVNLKEGGYKHLYNAAGIEQIENSAEHRVKEIQSSLNRLMKKFSQDIRNMAASEQ